LVPLFISANDKEEVMMSRKMTSILVVVLALFLITVPAWSGNSDGPTGPNGANSGYGPHGTNGDGDGDCDGPNGPGDGVTP
jgi:hypothetical protein